VARRPGHPKKLSDWKRVTIVRDYVGLCDFGNLQEAPLEHPYRAEFIRILARWHRTSQRMVERCLREAYLRRIYADNKEYLRGLEHKKYLKSLNALTDNKK
jgi:hypothetical protein